MGHKENKLFKWTLKGDTFVRVGIVYSINIESAQEIISNEGFVGEEFEIVELETAEALHVLFEHVNPNGLKSKSKTFDDNKGSKTSTESSEIDCLMKDYNTLSAENNPSLYIATIYPVVSTNNTMMITADSIEEVIYKIKKENIYEQIGGDYCTNGEENYPINEMSLIHVESGKKYVLRGKDLTPFQIDLDSDIIQITRLVAGTTLYVDYSSSFMSMKVSMDALLQKYRNVENVKMHMANCFETETAFDYLGDIFVEVYANGSVSISTVPMKKFWLCIDKSKYDILKFGFVYSETYNNAKKIYAEKYNLNKEDSETLVVVNIIDMLRTIEKNHIFK